MSIKNGLTTFLVVVLLIGIWEISALSIAELRLVLPSPSAILHRIISSPSRFLFHAQVTLGEMMAGFLLAFVSAFPLAWMMDLWLSARTILQPLFVVIQCIPMFALAPLMVLWFGWSATAIIVPTALIIFFPLTMNIYQGLSSTPQHLRDYFVLNKATSWQIFYKLQLPWAKDSIFSGIRIAAALAGIGAVTGEWAGAQSGLGLLMLESRRATDLETTFGALFCLTLASLALYSLIVFFERCIFTRTMRAKLFPALILFGIAFSGCSSSDSKSKEIRLLLDWLPNPNHVPVYVGMEKGFFANEGIALHVLILQDPSDSIPYLTSGRADLSLYFMPDYIRTQMLGINLQLVGVLFKEPLNCFIYRNDAGIKNPEDLNGKVIGYCVDGNNTLVLQKLLKNRNITPKEMRNVSFDLVSSLGTNQVDAIYGAYWNIEGEHLRSLGIETSHFDLASSFGQPSYYELVVVAKGDSPKMTPQFIQAFQRALQKSIDFSVQYPEEAFQLYAKANPDKSEKTLAWEYNAWKVTYPILARNQEIDQDFIHNFSHWFHDIIKGK